MSAPAQGITAGTLLAIAAALATLHARDIESAPIDLDSSVITQDANERSGRELVSIPDDDHASSRAREEASRRDPPASSASQAIEPARRAGGAPPIVLCGTVRDAHGDPLRRNAFEVTVTDGSARLLRASTSEGSYSLAGLASGRARIVASGTGWKRAVAEVEVAPGGGLRRVDLVLEHAPRIAITLRTDDGRPLRSTLQSDERLRGLQPSVIATREAPPARLDASALTFDQGDGSALYQRGRRGADASAADLPEGADGWLLLQAEPPLAVSVTAHQVVLATQRLEAGVAALEFVVPLERLRALLSGAVMRVVDAESGEPCAGASVWLQNEQTMGYLARADPQGIVRQVDRAPGLWELAISAPGYADLVVPHVFEPGVTSDLGDVRLQRPTRISGRVLGEDGAPIEGLLAFEKIVESGAPVSARLGNRSQTLVRSDGTFALTGCAPGRWALSFGNEAGFDPRLSGAPLAAGPLVVDSRAGAVENLEVRLAPATIVRLHGDPGADRRIDYEVRTAAGLPTGRSGRIEIDERVIALPPGDYVVIERSGAGEQHESTLRVGSGELVVELGR